MGQESRLEFQTVSYVRTSPCYICEHQPRPSLALSELNLHRLAQTAKKRVVWSVRRY
ncbi:hypothetical protein M405DRAFT_826378 [Rhizopogon salebrosus TDB-379]|nr:hypothetical protein M405DRAFT_826378 [Rhizopogon salebrosus TDB-379]